MEKEKPYKCECCGKRYKNLNGLKYHRQHTDMCNPEVQRQRREAQQAQAAARQAAAQGPPTAPAAGAAGMQSPQMQSPQLQQPPIGIPAATGGAPPGLGGFGGFGGMGQGAGSVNLDGMDFR